MGASVFTELEFCIQINAADVTAGDTVQLRVVRSTATAFTGAYTSPSINLAITKSPSTVAEIYSAKSTALKLTLKPATVLKDRIRVRVLSSRDSSAIDGFRAIHIQGRSGSSGSQRWINR